MLLIRSLGFIGKSIRDWKDVLSSLGVAQRIMFFACLAVDIGLWAAACLSLAYLPLISIVVVLVSVSISSFLLELFALTFVLGARWQVSLGRNHKE